MYHFSLLFTASMVFAAAIPSPAPTNEAPPCPSEAVTKSLSSVFGWQLVGTTQALDQTCAKLQENHLLKWANLGLSLPQISEPVCSTSTTPASDILPKVVVENTKTVTTLLNNAFPENDQETYGYLCSNLQYKRVAGFLLDDTTIINSTCQLAGGNSTPSPKPFTVPVEAEKNRTAVTAYNEAQSALYAYLYAAQATSASDLDTLCSNAAGQQMQDFETLQLNGDCIKNTICSVVQEPIDVVEGKQMLKKFSSKAFAIVLVNSSGVEGYTKRLCEKLDVERLESVGIDGQLVKDAVCSA